MDISTLMDNLSAADNLAVTMTGGAVEAEIHMESAFTRQNGEKLEIEGEAQAIRIDLREVKNIQQIDEITIMNLNNGIGVEFSCY